jgi:hypothetical protein
LLSRNLAPQLVLFPASNKHACSCFTTSAAPPSPRISAYPIMQTEAASSSSRTLMSPVSVTATTVLTTRSWMPSWPPSPARPHYCRNSPYPRPRLRPPASVPIPITARPHLRQPSILPRSPPPPFEFVVSLTRGDRLEYGPSGYCWHPD